MSDFDLQQLDRVVAFIGEPDDATRDRLTELYEAASRS